MDAIKALFEQKSSKYSHKNAKQRNQNQRMIAALTGDSIYSRDFYHFMGRCRNALYFEFCQDVFQLHRNYNANLSSQIESRYAKGFANLLEQDYFDLTELSEDKYRYDQILHMVLKSNMMKEHWQEFERQIGKSSFGYHSHVSNVGVLQFESLKFQWDANEAQYNPYIRMGLGKQAYETEVQFNNSQSEIRLYRQWVAGDGLISFNVMDIREQNVWIKVIDFNEYEQSKIIDSITVGLKRMKGMKGQPMTKQIKLKGGLLTFVVKFTAGKPFYYGNL